ncbi:MAG: thioredoxin family protein [Clostridiales bacterium]
MGNKSNVVLKIVIPILIICIIGVIWFVKNSDEESDFKNSKDVDNSEFALKVTEKLDIEKLKSHGLPIVIDFGSDECIPCKRMAPVLEELNSELHGKAIVKFVDIWKDPLFADGYPISVIPTQIFITSEGKPYNPSNAKDKNLKIYNDDSGKHTFTVHEGGIYKDELLSILKEMGLENE